MLQQVKSKAFKRSSGSLEVDNTHALVQDREDCAHQVISIGELLDLLPLGLFSLACTTEDRLVVLVLIFDTSFGSGDLLIALSFGLLDLLDEVVHLHDGIGGVDHHNVHIDELIIGNLFTSHHIAAVDDAVFHVLSVVVKENLLGVVVGLVDHHQLTSV